MVRLGELGDKSMIRTFALVGRSLDVEMVWMPVKDRRGEAIQIGDLARVLCLAEAELPELLIAGGDVQIADECKGWPAIVAAVRQVNGEVEEALLLRLTEGDAQEASRLRVLGKSEATRSRPSDLVA